MTHDKWCEVHLLVSSFALLPLNCLKELWLPAAADRRACSWAAPCIPAEADHHLFKILGSPEEDTQSILPAPLAPSE